MVERPELAVAWRLLEQLDASLLRDCDCWFGGGTAISLRCGEFRLSRDVDFLCASRSGYQRLRKQVFDRGARSLFLTPVDIVREARVDRYGIRLALRVDDQIIKFEIESEGRIDLDGIDESPLPVARLRDDDMVAEELLANTDR